MIRTTVMSNNSHHMMRKFTQDHTTVLFPDGAKQPMLSLCSTPLSFSISPKRNGQAETTLASTTHPSAGAPKPVCLFFLRRSLKEQPRCSTAFAVHPPGPSFRTCNNDEMPRPAFKHAQNTHLQMSTEVERGPV